MRTHDTRRLLFVVHASFGAAVHNILSRAAQAIMLFKMCMNEPLEWPVTAQYVYTSAVLNSGSLPFFFVSGILISALQIQWMYGSKHDLLIYRRTYTACTWLSATSDCCL